MQRHKISEFEGKDIKVVSSIIDQNYSQLLPSTMDINSFSNVREYIRLEFHWRNRQLRSHFSSFSHLLLRDKRQWAEFEKYYSGYIGKKSSLFYKNLHWLLYQCFSKLERNSHLAKMFIVSGKGLRSSQVMMDDDANHCVPFFQHFMPLFLIDFQTNFFLKYHLQYKVGCQSILFKAKGDIW